MRKFRTLTVWIQARQLAREVYPRTSHSPVEEQHGLTEVEKMSRRYWQPASASSPLTADT